MMPLKEAGDSPNLIIPDVVPYIDHFVTEGKLVIV
jgi:hypothetical protein